MDGFLLVLASNGEILYVSESILEYVGLTQVRKMVVVLCMCVCTRQFVLWVWLVSGVLHASVR